MKELLKKDGISEYSIFFDEETNMLFAFQKVSQEGNNHDLGNKEIVKKWWDHMKDIMITNPDNSPVLKDMEELFFME